MAQTRVSAEDVTHASVESCLESISNARQELDELRPRCNRRAAVILPARLVQAGNVEMGEADSTSSKSWEILHSKGNVGSTNNVFIKPETDSAVLATQIMDLRAKIEQLRELFTKQCEESNLMIAAQAEQVRELQAQINRLQKHRSEYEQPLREVTDSLVELTGKIAKIWDLCKGGMIQDMQFKDVLLCIAEGFQPGEGAVQIMAVAGQPKAPAVVGFQNETKATLDEPRASTAICSKIGTVAEPNDLGNSISTSLANGTLNPVPEPTASVTVESRKGTIALLASSVGSTATSSQADTTRIPAALSTPTLASAKFGTPAVPAGLKPSRMTTRALDFKSGLTDTLRSGSSKPGFGLPWAAGTSVISGKSKGESFSEVYAPSIEPVTDIPTQAKLVTAEDTRQAGNKRKRGEADGSDQDGKARTVARGQWLFRESDRGNDDDSDC